jgi:hypothetical protein
VSRLGRVVGVIAVGAAIFAATAGQAFADGGGSGGDSGGSNPTINASVTLTINGSSGGTVNPSGGGHGGGGGGGSGPPLTWIITPGTKEPCAAPACPPGQDGSTAGAWYFATTPDTSAGCVNPPPPIPCAPKVAVPATWVPTGSPPPSVGPPPPTAVQLAVFAEAHLPLPRPGGPFHNPNTVRGHTPDTPVNFPMWLWVDSASFRTQTVTASAAGISATTTAVPIDVIYDTGDGHSITCSGPGSAYNPGLPAEAQTTACSYKYSKSTDGRAPYAISATIDWSVSWSSNVGQSGTLPPLTTTSSGSLNVDQIESVNVGA